MNPAEIAQIVALAEQGFVSLVQLINSLKAAGVQTKTIEELLSQANANDDAIIAAAQAEIDKLNPPPAA
jgi:DNA-binding transcriptional MerR regulator